MGTQHHHRPGQCCSRGFKSGQCYRWCIVQSDAWLGDLWEGLDDGWLVEYHPQLTTQPGEFGWMYNWLSVTRGHSWFGVYAYSYENPPRWRFFAGSIGFYVCIDIPIAPTAVCPVELDLHAPIDGWPMCPVHIPYWYGFDHLLWRQYKTVHAAKQDFPNLTQKPLSEIVS